MSILDTSALVSVLGSSNHVCLVLPQRPSFDHISAALGLKIGLDASGKQTRVVSPDPVLVEFNRLVGIDTVVDTFGSRDLVITFPSQTEHVDKVSYNLDKGELQLVISPKSDAPELDHRQLKFIAGVSRTDLIITIGVNRLSDLGRLSESAKNLFSSVTSLSIHHRESKEKFATHELHYTDASSLSELVTHIFESTDLKLDQDAASNLLSGIEKATNNYQHPSVSVGTFEASAILMRKGAKRHIEISASQFPPGSIPAVQTPVPQASAPVSNPQSKPSIPVQTNQPVHITPKTQPAPSSQSGYGTDGSNTSSPSQTKVQKPPADWYEPKIFKGPMLP